ncbi:MAG: UDP-3-O-(3-hydroxymyristoyl)glucosamine N-acyltransferase [Proteobacteria bacterium]|nr:UDP-3-O-(3-hydroxymyristoyl)glucosamine N-acyltransferase [Pseudomonadota bacterium]
MAVTLGELAVRFGCELRGEPGVRVARVGTLAGAGADALAFLANPRYRAQLDTTSAAAVVVNAAAAAAAPCAVLVSENPYATYARIAQLLHPPPPLNPGVHPSAVVHADARVDASAEVAALAVVAAGAVIGPRAFIGPHCTVGGDARIGEDVRLVARVTVGSRVEIGARTIVQPGAVLGGDGFGFAPDKRGWVKVPQVGAVRIGPDVEIGANTAIDRGAIEDTVIEEGVKLDNLVQVAHNVRIGAHTAIAACVGVSGSTSIGRRCMVGGHTGFAGHINIADDVVVTGFSMITHSIKEPGVYSSGIPFEDARTWRRLVARFKRLPLLEGRVRRLERPAGGPTSGDGDDGDE